MRDDPLWRLPAYRFALYLGDLAQLEDAPLVRRDYRTRPHLDQFLDAAGSISANLAEGYGRTTGPDRAKFFEYAQSSARECRDWYFKVRHALAPGVAFARIDLVTRIIKIVTVAINDERAEAETRARRAARVRRPLRTKPTQVPRRPPSTQQPHPAPSE